MQFAHGFKTKTAKCATENIDCFGEIISWVNYGFLCRRRTISRCHFIHVSLGWRRQFDAFCSLITFKYSLLCVLNNLPFLTSSLAHLLRLSGNSVEKNFCFTQIYIVVEFWYQGFVFTGRLLFSWSVSRLWVLSFFFDLKISYRCQFGLVMWADGLVLRPRFSSVSSRIRRYFFNRICRGLTLVMCVIRRHFGCLAKHLLW